MRIQHNIMAMTAYRNYTNNTSALAGNLEKLSSGYKINRAGDDAAGLAISEKMRAQITGLEAAQKNVKDGISLVKTAEGAMQEIQDMLNRMDYLATQSANGTYQDEVDREAIQKEVDQLRTEINRIADSANFNGIKLLDGSLDANTTDIVTQGSDRIIQEVYSPAVDGAATSVTGVKTILDGPPVAESKTTFTVNFSGLTATTKSDEPTGVPSVKSEAGTVAAAEPTIEGSSAANTIDVGSTGDADAKVTYTAGSALASALAGESANDGDAISVKCDTTGNDPVWTISDANSNDVTVAASTVKDGVLTLMDAEGETLMTIDSGNINATRADFQTAFSAGEATGFSYAEAFEAGGTQVDSNDVTYEAGSDLVDVLAEKGVGDDAEISVEYVTGDTAWKITAGTVDIEGLTGTLSADNKTMTLTDAEGNELLKITAAAAVTASDFTGDLGSTEATGLVYSGSTPTILTGATNATTYEAGDALVDALTDAGAADGDAVSVEYDGTDWNITAGSASIKAASAEFSYDDGTLTLKDAAGNALMTLTSDKASVSEAAFQAEYGTAVKSTLVYSDGTSSSSSGSGSATDEVKFDFKLNGTDLATDVTVDDEATAKDIAAAVFKGLTDASEDTDPDGIVGMQVKLGEDLYTVTDNGDGTLTFTLASDLTTENASGNFDWDVSATAGGFKGNHTAGTVVATPGVFDQSGQVANTVFEIKDTDIVDGAKITIDGQSVTLSVGKDSAVKAGEGVVDLTDLDTNKIDLNLALSRISQAFADGTKNFIVGVNDTSNGDVQMGLTIHKKDSSEEMYLTKEALEGVFSLTTSKTGAGTAMNLQIGDTSDSFNQMKVSIGDMHTDAMGTTGGMTIADISVGTSADAQKAVDVIKDAINYVSSVRGDLGAYQNRLEHTANNLSVMAENITDAESTIRDTDVAEEMMSYVKNNILVQSAQAMLAQANQVPQGVLQLLG